jgi:hypothetical protein
MICPSGSAILKKDLLVGKLNNPVDNIYPFCLHVCEGRLKLVSVKIYDYIGYRLTFDLATSLGTISSLAWTTEGHGHLLYLIGCHFTAQLIREINAF